MRGNVKARGGDARGLGGGGGVEVVKEIPSIACLMVPLHHPGVQARMWATGRSA